MKEPPPPPNAPAGTPAGATRTANPLPALERLTLLLQLQRQARHADADELPFVMVNETRQLLPYRQAALLIRRGRRAKLAAVSGLAVPDAASPFAQWLARFARWHGKNAPKAGVERFSFPQCAETGADAPKWLAGWSEWLPPHGVWASLADAGGEADAALLLFREAPFTDAEMLPLTHLVEAYGQSWALRSTRRPRRARSLARWLWLLAAAAVVAAGFVPVPQTVLAPAEVTARRPALVRSGLDGVVERILVEPNQYVEEGEPLVRLDDAQLRTRLAVAQKAEDMAAVEYRQLAQAAFHDAKSKQRLPLIQGRMEQLAAETAYIRSQLERVVVASPARDVVLCDNPDEWRGRPVSLGQRIAMVADPGDLELEIHLPVNEALRVEVGDRLLFYPNVSPIAPVEAVVTFVGYRAAEQPGAGMAFTLRADLADAGAAPLLGLRGTGKLYGRTLPLGLHILRVPLLTVRQWLGG